MSQNTSAIMNKTQTPVYVGLDIAKASLQLHLQNKSYDLPNTSDGHAKLLRHLADLPAVQVICEATGGYERAVVGALHTARIPVSVMNPSRVRQFARASGKIAKTDPIDAAVLSAFGTAFAPSASTPRSAVETKMSLFIARRLQLIQMQVAESPTVVHTSTQSHNSHLLNCP